MSEHLRAPSAQHLYTAVIVMRKTISLAYSFLSLVVMHPSLANNLFEISYLRSMFVI